MTQTPTKDQIIEMVRDAIIYKAKKELLKGAKPHGIDSWIITKQKINSVLTKIVMTGLEAGLDTFNKRKE